MPCAIKTRRGYKEQECRDHQTTHVILTVDEYDNMRNHAESLQRNLANEQSARQSDKRQAERDALNDHNKVVREANEAIEGYKAQIARLKDDIRSKEYLYGNMKRIMRENANRDRGLRPKKQHEGYVVLQSRQADFAYMDGRKRMSAKIWITTLQSFYDASIPIAQVRREIEHDFAKGGVLASLGFYKWSGDPDGDYQTFTDDEGNDKNGLFRWRYNSNYKSGFWEIVLYHTKSITVPREMRPSA